MYLPRIETRARVRKPSVPEWQVYLYVFYCYSKTLEAEDFIKKMGLFSTES